MLNLKKVNSGMEGLDRELDYIRYGDNVLWKISDIKEYEFFVKPFVEQAIADRKNVVYFRYSKHEQLCFKNEGIKIVELDLSQGFELTALQVNDVIEREGSETHYVFDNMTDLQYKWVADFMMVNFFIVTAPIITKNNCVAYYAFNRNYHSFESIARMREAASILIDVFKGNNSMYLQPLRVNDRYHPTMFLPHRVDKDDIDLIKPLTNGIEVSRFYALVGSRGNMDSFQNLDNWERFFLEKKQELADNPHCASTKTNIRALCKMMFTADERILDIAQENLSLNDILDIKSRMIGVGSIGGKSTGMILSRMIVDKHLPEIAKILEPHDSFYICSNLYYTFLIKNNCWGLKIKQRKKKGYFPIAEVLKEKILEGEFSDNIREQFRRMLQYYGQSPIIVRSSSLLEDGFGNAFAGKYESVFCVNKGTLENRLQAFEDAVRTVYASTMDESVLEYRLQRGLSHLDEQMGILVQRVSGSLFKEIFMPAAAGVGYSYNSYRWHKSIDPDVGMLRLVMGLGTRAVDRTDGDYPRIVSIDKPDLLTHSSDYPSKFAQHNLDVLELSTNSLRSVPISEVKDEMADWFQKLFIERDFKREAELKEIGLNKKIEYTTCKNLIKNEEFISAMDQILNTVEKEYDYPVDVEFAINISKDGDFVINLLQCRPLQVGGSGMRVEMPKNISPEKTFFHLDGGTMGGEYYQELDLVIQVDPEKYYKYPYNKKAYVARIIGEINKRLEGKKSILLVPGRLGTSSPELGVPVAFSEICNINVACEVSYEGGGYMPELSFGSHFFQDLVEANIFYVSIFENKEETLSYNPRIFENQKNMLRNYVSELDDPDLENIIKVYEVDMSIVSDLASGQTLCGYF